MCSTSRNPQADLQAMDRAHRIGQKKQVYVFRFVTEVRPVLVSLLSPLADPLRLCRTLSRRRSLSVPPRS